MESLVNIHRILEVQAIRTNDQEAESLLIRDEHHRRVAEIVIGTTMKSALHEIIIEIKPTKDPQDGIEVEKRNRNPTSFNTMTGTLATGVPFRMIGRKGAVKRIMISNLQDREMRGTKEAVTVQPVAVLVSHLYVEGCEEADQISLLEADDLEITTDVQNQQMKNFQTMTMTVTRAVTQLLPLHQKKEGMRSPVM